MVNLTIDGVAVSVERGTSILEAAQKAGVRIPTLCNDKRLIPFGACRLCIVEVTARGKTRTMPACFNPARDGMEVATHTPRLVDARRKQLSLILRSHPLQCPGCDACGDCDLQRLVYEYRVEDLTFERENRYYHLDNDSKFIRHNMNLCIKCGMCVRICDEVQGQSEISLIHRGIESEVSTDFGRPLDCEFCGQCASICPVGAISSKWLVGTGRPFELKSSLTVCSFCSLGCVLSMDSKGGKVVYANSPGDSPNEGSLCVKGRYGWPYVYSADRPARPLLRKNGTLEEAGWDETLKFVADKFNAVKKAHGPSSLAALGSERLTNEEAYVFNRFVKTVLETPNLDHAGGYGYRSLVDGLAPVLGYPASTNPIREIKKAHVVLLIGADLTETHPVAKNEVIVASIRNRCEVIVVDSVRTKLTDRPGMFLRTPLGAEHIVAYSMLRHIIDEELYDKAALQQKTEGLEGLIESLKGYEPEKVGESLGLDPSLIREAAAKYAKAESAFVITTCGMNRLGPVEEIAKAAANLAAVTGHIGKEGSGVMVLGEKANAQGAVDMGLVPDLLPGGQSVEDEAARSKLEALWGCSIPGNRGMSAEEILDGAIRGEIKGLYIVGENPLETYPDRQKVEKALRSLELLVVQDIFVTSTAEMAHAMLPVASYAEKSGTVTSVDRRIQLLIPFVERKGVRTDLEIFCSLSGLMGKTRINYHGPEDVMKEICGVVEVYRGVSYDRLGDFGITWPCQDSEDLGREILYIGGFRFGKAKLACAPAFSVPSSEGLPFDLVPATLKFHSGSFSERSFSLMDVSPEAFAEMSSTDMESLGIKDGDSVRIKTSDGAMVQVKAKYSYRALPGTVIVPHHFSAVKLNSLTRWGQPRVRVQVEKV